VLLIRDATHATAMSQGLTPRNRRAHRRIVGSYREQTRLPSSKPHTPCWPQGDQHLRALGKLLITGASHVEPDSDGDCWADMGPSGWSVPGPFGSRREAIQVERGWMVVRA